MRDPHGDLGVNCVSTMNLVEACRHHNRDARLVFTSTRQVYGRARNLPVTEDPVVNAAFNRNLDDGDPPEDPPGDYLEQEVWVGKIEPASCGGP